MKISKIQLARYYEPIADWDRASRGRQLTLVQCPAGRAWTARGGANQARARMAECLEFSRGVGDAIVKTDPKLYTTTFAKVGGERKILRLLAEQPREHIGLCLLAACTDGGAVSMPLAGAIDRIARGVDVAYGGQAPQASSERSVGDNWDCHQEIPHPSFAAVRAL